MPLHFPKHIRIAALGGDICVEDLFAIQNENGTKLHALEAFFIKLLSSALHFSYSIKPSQVGLRKENGSWSGVFGMLQREEADFALGFLSITEERTHVVDFSLHYHITDTTFLTDHPESLSKSLTIFYPFEYRIWITFIPLLFVASVIFYAMKSRNRSFQYVLMRVFGSVLEQALLFNFRSCRKRLFAFTWISCIMFLSYSYKGLLLSFLSFPPKFGLRNIADLSKAVASGSHTCVALPGSYIITALRESKDPDLRIIGESLVKNSGIIFDYKNIMKEDQKFRKVYIGFRSFLRVNEKHFFVSQDSFFTSFIAVAVRKTFCCKKKLDKTIRRTFEAGLYEKFLRELEMSGSFTINPLHVDLKDSRALTIDDISGALYILTVGHILAGLALIGEIFLQKH